MLYLKIIPLYILNLVAYNIGFVIFSFLCILSFCYAGDFEDDKYIKEVIHSGEVSGNYYYVLDDGEELQLKTESKEIPIVDKQIEYSSYSGINILLWASFIILLVGLLIYIFGESNEIDTTEALRDAVWTLTHSEMDKGGIDYLLFDRFIRRSKDTNRLLHKSDIVGNIRTLSDITSLPKHYTVKKDRINKLKKLDI